MSYSRNPCQRWEKWFQINQIFIQETVLKVNHHAGCQTYQRPKIFSITACTQEGAINNIQIKWPEYVLLQYSWICVNLYIYLMHRNKFEEQSSAYLNKKTICISSQSESRPIKPQPRVQIIAITIYGSNAVSKTNRGFELCDVAETRYRMIQSAVVCTMPRR